MKKKYIIIPVAALATLGVGVGIFLANDKVKLIDDNIVIEAGTDIKEFDINKYIDASKSKIEKLTIDTSNVDTSKVGEYEIIITYKKQELKLKVSVTDTTAPIITPTSDSLKAKVGENVLIENLDVNITDASKYTLTFEDGTTTTSFTESGEVKKKIIATDIYNNSSEMELTFNVADANAPVFDGYGTKDRTVYLENGINLMDGVFATDVEDGDITDKIKVSDVDVTTLGVKDVTYSVEDKSGNTASITIKLTIESVIEELDKTMYATSVISARKASNGESEKLGDIAYAQSVHVTGRDKNTGWYRIEYNGGVAWVSDSYLSDTEPVVQTPQNNNSTKPSSSSSNSNCASSDCSHDCSTDCKSDCDCDCTSNCDCSSDCSSNCGLSDLIDGDCASNCTHNLSTADCGW